MVKISLLALFVNERNEIKDRLNKYYDEKVEWVPLTNLSIDILITRAKFLETPTIISQINKSKQDQKLKMVLTIATTVEEQIFSENLNIASLLLPIESDQEFIHWLSDQPSNQPVTSDQLLGQNNLNLLLKYISQQIKLKTHYQTINLGANPCLIDFKKLKIYSTDNKLTLTEDINFEITNQPTEVILEQGTVFDLNSILWSLLNQAKSTINFGQFFEKDRQYILNAWPLFIKNLKEYRLEALNIVATLQKTSHSYDAIAARKDEKLIKFFSLLNILGYLDMKDEAVEFIPDDAMENIRNIGFIKKFRNFITKLI